MKTPVEKFLPESFDDYPQRIKDNAERFAHPIAQQADKLIKDGKQTPYQVVMDYFVPQAAMIMLLLEQLERNDKKS